MTVHLTSFIILLFELVFPMLLLALRKNQKSSSCNCLKSKDDIMEIWFKQETVNPTYPDLLRCLTTQAV